MEIKKCRGCGTTYSVGFMEDGLCMFCLRPHREHLAELYRRYQDAEKAYDAEQAEKLAHDIAAYQLENGILFRDGPKKLQAKLP